MIHNPVLTSTLILFGGGIVRCKACFEMICDSSPALLDKDLLQVQRKMEKSPGNTLGAGLMIQKERVEKLMTGGNQPWYSFKNMMLEHASCTTRNGETRRPQESRKSERSLSHALLRDFYVIVGLGTN